MSLLDFFVDLINPDLPFLGRALIVALLAAVMCGAVGCYVVLRGMAFMGEAVAHSVFPGVALAFVFGGSLIVGGMVAGVITACLIALLSYSRKIAEDAVIGVLFVAAFALGVVVISLSPGYSGSLTQFLFGSLAGVGTRDVMFAAGACVCVLALLLWLHPRLVTVSLDRESAGVLGIPVLVLDIALYVLVTLAVVVSIQSIGNVLVLALLITPAATARLITNKIAVMLWLSPAIGAVGAFLGVYLSWTYDVPTGACIVLVLTVGFTAAWLTSTFGRCHPTKHRTSPVAA